MDVLPVLLCCFALWLPMLLGLGISYYAERFLGRRAYLVGWLVPIILFITFYGLYHLWLRLLSCTPVERLICGEPFLNLFLLFACVLGVVMLANGAAQFALYLFVHRRDAPPTLEAEQESQVSDETHAEENTLPVEPEQMSDSQQAAALPVEGDVLAPDEPTPE